MRRCAYSDRPPRLVSSPRRPPRSTTSVSFAALHPLCAIRRREHHPCAFRSCSAGLGGGTGPTDGDRLPQASPSPPYPPLQSQKLANAAGARLWLWSCGFWRPSCGLSVSGQLGGPSRLEARPSAYAWASFRPPVGPAGSRQCHVLRRSPGHLLIFAALSCLFASPPLLICTRLTKTILHFRHSSTPARAAGTWSSCSNISSETDFLKISSPITGRTR